MANVSVYDPKEEGEGGNREEGGVGLPVAGDAVRVDKLLVAVRELVGAKVGGRCGPRLGYLRRRNSR